MSSTWGKSSTDGFQTLPNSEHCSKWEKLRPQHSNRKTQTNSWSCLFPNDTEQLKIHPQHLNTHWQWKSWTERRWKMKLPFLSSGIKIAFLSPCRAAAQTRLPTPKQSEPHCQHTITVWKTSSFGRERMGRFFHNVWECLARRKPLLAACWPAGELVLRTADSADTLQMC